LKIKHLLDVSKALKIKHFSLTPKPLQSVKPLKIKYLMKFFGVLECTAKTRLPDPPAWHDFCMQEAQHFYTFLYHSKNSKNKNKKSIKSLRE
jgi:hypothetical protein